MKVLIFPSFTGIALTKEMKNIYAKKNFPENRTGEIIEYLEKHAEKIDEEKADETIEKLKTERNKIYCIRDYYYLYEKDIECIATLKIVDVDITRPWCIREYDGSEYIQYLDYKVFNKEMNYCVEPVK